MHKLTHYLAIIGFILSFSGFAQDVTLKSYVDKNKVTVNQLITFEIETNSRCQIYQPDFGGLHVLQGPIRSHAAQSVLVNGGMAMVQQYKLSYRLRAQRPGTYKIAAVMMDCNGEKYESKPISITVTEANQAGQDSQVPANGSSDFYIRLYSNKKDMYQGEPFLLTLKMFSKKQPQNLEGVEFGDSKGLWRKDLNPDQTNFTSEMEIINGVRYYTTVIKSELCFAQTSGKIEIEPAEISAIFRRGLFGGYRRAARSNRVTVNVKPLPNNAPASFNGLVGQFELEHDISKTTIKPGDAIDLKLKISGKGNLNTFDNPELDIPSDFEQFDPEVKQNYNYRSSGINGNISYNYVLVPTFYGEYSIPAYTFTYFDPEAEAYKTLSTGNFNINVLKTDNAQPKPGSDISNTQKEIEIKHEDIHHLMPTDEDLFKTGDLLIKRPLFYTLAGLPFLTLFLIYARRRQLGTASKQNIRQQKAIITETQNLLATARQKQNDGQDQESVKAVHHAFKQYIQRKLNVDTTDMTLTHIQSQLHDRNIDESLVNQTASLWQTLDLYQYAPIAPDQLGSLIDQTASLIEQFEKILSK